MSQILRGSLVHPYLGFQNKQKNNLAHIIGPVFFSSHSLSCLVSPSFSLVLLLWFHLSCPFSFTGDERDILLSPERNSGGAYEEVPDTVWMTTLSRELQRTGTAVRHNTDTQTCRATHTHTCMHCNMKTKQA